MPLEFKVSLPSTGNFALAATEVQDAAAWFRGYLPPVGKIGPRRAAPAQAGRSHRAVASSGHSQVRHCAAIPSVDCRESRKVVPWHWAGREPVGRPWQKGGTMMSSHRIATAALICGLVLAGVVGTARAQQDHATPQEVVQKVRQAAQDLAKSGEAGLATFSGKNATSVWKDSYTFVISCEGGKAVDLAHPIKPELKGKPTAQSLTSAPSRASSSPPNSAPRGRSRTAGGLSTTTEGPRRRSRSARWPTCWRSRNNLRGRRRHLRPDEQGRRTEQAQRRIGMLRQRRGRSSSSGLTVSAVGDCSIRRPRQVSPPTAMSAVSQRLCSHKPLWIQIDLKLPAVVAQRIFAAIPNSKGGDAMRRGLPPIGLASGHLSQTGHSAIRYGAAMGAAEEDANEQRSCAR